jgi:hypothetical protein
MKKYCCKKMKAYTTEKNSLVDYDSYTRRYSFFVDSPNGTHEFMEYCPWCGTQLPAVLADTWCDILKKDFNIDDLFREWDRVPTEFKTDEWWKKRGL